MQRAIRVIYVLSLLGLDLSLCVSFAAADLWDTPCESSVAADPAAHHGKRVFMFVEVVASDSADDHLIVEAPGHRMVITEVAVDEYEMLEPGAEIQVAGPVAAASDELVADDIVIDIRNDRDRWYLYGVSVLGVLLAAGDFL